MSRIALRTAALGYLAALLVIPVGMVFYRAFENGFGAAWDAVTTPPAQHAFFLTITVALIAVPANAIFGVLTAWLLAHYDFRGKRVLDVLIDLPFAVSPVVVGLSLILVWGRDGWFPSTEVIFSTPGIVLATIFVSLPFVVREVLPVLEEEGTDSEQAAWLYGIARNLLADWRRRAQVERRAMAMTGSCSIASSLARSVSSWRHPATRASTWKGATAHTTASKCRCAAPVSSIQPLPSGSIALTRVPIAISAQRSPSHSIAGSGKIADRSIAGMRRSESSRALNNASRITLANTSASASATGVLSALTHSGSHRYLRAASGCSRRLAAPPAW